MSQRCWEERILSSYTGEKRNILGDLEQGVTPRQNQKNVLTVWKSVTLRPSDHLPRRDHPFPRLLQDFTAAQWAHRSQSMTLSCIWIVLTFHWLSSMNSTITSLHLLFPPGLPWSLRILHFSLRHLWKSPICSTLSTPYLLKPLMYDVISNFSTSSTSSFRIPFTSCSTKTWGLRSLS